MWFFSNSCYYHYEQRINYEQKMNYNYNKKKNKDRDFLTRKVGRLKTLLNKLFLK
jgi:hypothetical protein